MSWVIKTRGLFVLFCFCWSLKWNIFAESWEPLANLQKYFAFPACVFGSPPPSSLVQLISLLNFIFVSTGLRGFLQTVLAELLAWCLGQRWWPGFRQWKSYTVRCGIRTHVHPNVHRCPGFVLDSPRRSGELSRTLEGKRKLASLGMLAFL